MKRIYLLLFALVTCHLSQLRADECALDSMTVVVDHCGGKAFYVYVDFDLNDGVGETFNIFGNGMDYGQFTYDELPVKLGPLTLDSDISYEFSIVDGQDSTCTLAYELGVVDCFNDCEITELDIEMSDCDPNGAFDVFINFAASDFDRFDVYQNYEAIGFYHIDDLPIKIQGLSASGADLESFKICANDRSNCCEIIELAAPDCHPTCISDLSIDLKSCDSIGIEILVDLEHGGAHSDGFMLRGNGREYGNFKYGDLPIALSVAGVEHALYEFVAIDLEDSACKSITTIEAPCAEKCKLIDPSIEISSCEDGVFSVQIDFLPHRDASTSFGVKGNGAFYGYYRYQDLPIAIEDLDADASKYYEFHIEDSSAQSCLGVLELGPIYCQCLIKDLVVASGECSGEDTYVVELDFETESFLGFDLYINDTYFKNYAVEDLPLRIEDFPASGLEMDKLKIYAQDVDDCYIKTYVSRPSCIRNECGLNSLAMEVTDCDGGASYAWINFQHDADHSKYFTVRGDGEDYGKFAYDALPVKVGPLEHSDEGFFELIIEDREFRSCSLVVEGKTDCSAFDCAFDDITAVVNTCDDSLMFSFTLDFKKQGELSSAFIVDVCEETFLFNYTDLPVEVGPFAGGETFYHFTISDTSYACISEAVIGTVVCEEQCTFEDVETEIIECLDDSIYVLRIHQISGPFSAFDVYVNDEYYGFYPEDALPLDLSIHHLKEVDLLTICVSDNTTCCLTKEIDPEECRDKSPCDIVEFRVDTIFCARDSFYAMLTIHHEGDGDSFTIKGNGQNYGTFLYTSSPIKIGPLPSGKMVYEFEVSDVENGDCLVALELGEVDCPTNRVPADQRLLILESGSRSVQVRIPDMVQEPSLFEVFDLQGRLMHQIRFSSDSEFIVLEIPPLLGGMYVLRLQNRSGLSDVRKFIMH